LVLPADAASATHAAAAAATNAAAANAYANASVPAAAAARSLPFSKASDGAKSIARFNVFTCALVADVFYASAALSFFSSPSHAIIEGDEEYDDEEYEDETAAWSLLVLGLAHLVSSSNSSNCWGEESRYCLTWPLTW